MVDISTGYLQVVIYTDANCTTVAPTTEIPSSYFSAATYAVGPCIDMVAMDKYARSQRIIDNGDGLFTKQYYLSESCQTETALSYILEPTTCAADNYGTYIEVSYSAGETNTYSQPAGIINPAIIR